MTKREKLQNKIAAMLDNYWLSIVSQPNAPQDAKVRLEGQYAGALQLVVALGFDWKRDESGKHKVFGEPRV